MLNNSKPLSDIERIQTVVKMIPAGQVSTYGRIADYAGLLHKARYVSYALAQASHDSLPWHRVINSQGKIAIAKGNPSYFKQIELLRLEAIQVNHGRVNLKQYLWHPDAATLIFSLSF
ncbi:cysteine methyltransferase [Shewanella sp. SNU WT4]|uniref:MGMT family protein n=1 Tax=Shewanella sp. SNU WT4 TaxID=2590015 RepID=UPI0011287FA6|nr:MGMT family protein [Shewanella sp. SNU WT4]QDF67127.1 cysteine methyltransferase [Shewanella sp. SNU WT4]